MPKTDKPNILVIWGNDIGHWNISHYDNIDRIAQKGARRRLLFSSLWNGRPRSLRATLVAPEDA
jgi:hypothetical protein